MRGTTEECLRHYLAQFPTLKRGVTKDRLPFAQYIGVTESTVRRWMSGNGEPIGFVLVKVRYFLQENGYEVKELQTLDPDLRILGWLITHHKVVLEDVIRELGLEQKQSRLLQALHGHQLLSPARMEVVAAFCEQHRREYASTVADTEVERQSISVVERTASSEPTPDDAIQPLLRALDAIVTVLGPYLDRVLSDGMSADDRRVLREKLGANFVFDLSNRVSRTNRQLSGLCSEKAREKTRGGAR